MKDINKIFSSCCALLGVEPREILEKNRTKVIAYKRHLIAYVLVRELEFGSVETSKVLGYRDHTSVLHACTSIANQLVYSTQVNGDLSELLLTLGVNANLPVTLLQFNQVINSLKGILPDSFESRNIAYDKYLQHIKFKKK